MKRKMRNQFIGSMIALLVLSFASISAAGQAATGVRRTPDGKPDLSGIWRVMNAANFDLQDHIARTGVSAGQGVVEGNDIPYQPAAAAKKKANFENRKTADPESKCYMPGVPRITYMPYPFQIFQTPEQVAIVYEYLHVYRVIRTDGSKHMEGVDFWMGDPRGHWEGDTLVVDVTDFNDQTWFDRAGNFHSDALHVVERYTPLSADHINYEVTIEDPKVFTRPWKMNMILYRQKEKNAQILEYECYVYLEEDVLSLSK